MNRRKLDGPYELLHAAIGFLLLGLFIRVYTWPFIGTPDTTFQRHLLGLVSVYCSISAVVCVLSGLKMLK